jgi:hypothetical protein
MNWRIWLTLGELVSWPEWQCVLPLLLSEASGLISECGATLMIDIKYFINLISNCKSRSGYYVIRKSEMQAVLNCIESPCNLESPHKIMLNHPLSVTFAHVRTSCLWCSLCDLPFADLTTHVSIPNTLIYLFFSVADIAQYIMWC